MAAWRRAAGVAACAAALVLVPPVAAIPVTSFTLTQDKPSADNCLAFLELMVFNADTQLVSVLGSPGVTVSATPAGQGACGVWRVACV